MAKLYGLKIIVIISLYVLISIKLQNNLCIDGSTEKYNTILQKVMFLTFNDSLCSLDRYANSHTDVM